MIHFFKEYFEQKTIYKITKTILKFIFQRVFSSNEEQEQDNETDGCLASNNQIFLSEKPSSSNSEQFSSKLTIADNFAVNLSNNNKANTTPVNDIQAELLNFNNENFAKDFLLLNSCSFNNPQVFVI